jgi:hypothetical protein
VLVLLVCVILVTPATWIQQCSACQIFLYNAITWFTVQI